MGDGIKAMWEDAEDYQRLAAKFNEPTRCDWHGWPYGMDSKHHAELEKRERDSAPPKRTRS